MTMLPITSVAKNKNKDFTKIFSIVREERDGCLMPAYSKKEKKEHLYFCFQMRHQSLTSLDPSQCFIPFVLAFILFLLIFSRWKFCFILSCSAFSTTLLTNTALTHLSLFVLLVVFGCWDGLSFSALGAARKHCPITISKSGSPPSGVEITIFFWCRTFL